MAERRPIVLVNGELQELPSGDTLPGSSSSPGVETTFSTHAAFTPPESTTFTVDVGAGPIIQNGYDSVTKRYRMQKAAAGLNAKLASVPASSNFTRIFVLSFMRVPATFNFSGIAVRNSANGKTITFGRFSEDNRIFHQLWNNTTFVSELSVPGGNSILSTNSNTIWIKVQRTGDVIAFSISADGINWSPDLYTQNVVSGHLGGNVDLVGPFINNTSPSYSFLDVIGYDTNQQPPYAAIGPAGPMAEMVQTQITATAHTLDNTDLAGNVVRRMNNASTITVTVAPDLTGTEPVTFIRTGAGAVTFAAGAGVTLLSAGGNRSIADQYGSATLIPDSTTPNTYYLIGILTT